MVVGLRKTIRRVCKVQALGSFERSHGYEQQSGLLNVEHWRESSNALPRIPRILQHTARKHALWRPRLVELGKVSARCGDLYAWVQALRACDEKGSKHSDLREPGTMDTCEA